MHPSRFCSALAGLTLAIILAPAPAQAHGIWLATRTGALAVIYGHGAQDDAYKPEKIKKMSGLTENGAAREVKLVPHPKNATIDPPNDVAVIATLFDNGVWTEGPDGKWHNLGKSQVPNARKGGHAIKYNTHRLARSAAPPRPTGARLEIVPIVDPIALKRGSELAVLVLYDGKPLAGVKLINDYVNNPHEMSAARTDADGKIILDVANDGLNVLAVAFDEEVSGNKGIDAIWHFATFSFVLPHHE